MQFTLDYSLLMHHVYRNEHQDKYAEFNTQKDFSSKYWEKEF